MAFWPVLHAFQHVMLSVLGFFSFSFNSAVKILIVLMKKPVTLVLSNKTVLRVFAANNHSENLLQATAEIFLSLQRSDLSFYAFWL